ncbi:NAD(P)-dependent oxidoreductase [Micromonospora sp. STR1_7]|uniref:NAD(P)-dependent oxidoreductase n=1 Tax=Micromonospora parastrephiae TaxID=2806101 RepID=A0ABS1XSK2_9ACTN|nr:NAD(P)-binding domain-containing protein [Micromonospora parastrephiae]MBM0232238.1 NAD(P)-dependent oxidoreductase [Micromonospora parastrephiae]
MTHRNLDNQSAAVAVLGLGPMGRALAAASLAAGHPTLLWNRSPGKATALVAQGAVLAPTVADAARRASVVIACVINYRAVRAVMSGLERSPRGTFVNLSSGHAAEARDMAAWAAQRGVNYLDGAILTPAPTIGTPAATILYSGPRALFDDSLPWLESFGGSSVHLGADAGTAAAYEMALLDLFTMSVGGLAHAFALAITEGIPPTAFARFARGIGGLLPDMADRFADQLTSGTFAADVSTIASAGSAVAHVRDAAAARGVDPAPLQAVQSIIERAVAAGHGGDSYARLAQSLVPADLAEAAR